MRVHGILSLLLSRREQRRIPCSLKGLRKILYAVYQEKCYLKYNKTFDKSRCPTAMFLL